MALEDLEDLVRTADEGLNVDLKQAMSWDELTTDEKCSLVKDFLSMANTRDGGKIIVGRRDSDGGLEGLSENQFASWDQTKVNDFLQKYADPPFSVAVRRLIVDGERVVVLDVPEYQETPILCARDAHSTKVQSKQLLKAATLYTRTDKATSEPIRGSKEMREFLNRAVLKRSGEMLADIQHILQGAPVESTTDADRKGYGNEEDEAIAFLGNTLSDKQEYGYWEIRAAPVRYDNLRIPELNQVERAVRDASVSLRGWPFPHVNHVEPTGLTGNFGNGFQSHTLFQRIDEALRAYTSGLFMWQRLHWEDIEERHVSDRRILSFIGAVYSILEFFLFISRYSRSVAPENDWQVRVSIHGTQGRALVSIDPAISLHGLYICKVASVDIFDEVVSDASLRISYQDLALRATMRLFHSFNWNQDSERVTRTWQEKLLSRDF